MTKLRGARKRVFDLVFSALALVALSPVLLAVAVAVKLGSPGPVFFVASRYGQGWRPFDFYKFRTMVSDAQSRGSRMLTTAGDSRVTSVGRVLRAFKLDELPQLLNVLKGDMSLVGPRPEVPEVVDHYYRDEWDEVLKIRPGLTCLLQVEVYPDFTTAHAGVEDPLRHYVEKDLPLKLRLDREYVETRSFLLDLRIIWQTVWCIVFKSGGTLSRRRHDQGPPQGPRPNDFGGEAS